MLKSKYRLLSIILSLMLILGCVPAMAFAEMNESTVVESGMCGDNVTWELTTDGTLILSGNGKMSNYNWHYSYSPFYNKDDILRVEIKDGITSIGNYMFWSCDSLKTVSIPNSVESIGEHTFSDCTSLTAVEIPSSVTSIGSAAFWNCSSLLNITIPDKITNIESYLFSGCVNITNLIIPNGVTKIGDNAFQGCEKLTGLTIPNGVTSIGSDVFKGCSNLTTIEIPDSVISIGKGAFSGCEKLTSITIPNGVTSIESGTFYNCNNLSSIEIPDGVTYIGSDAFYKCYNLSSIEIPDGVTYIGGSAFFKCTSLCSVTLPSGITAINSYLFQNCYSLENVNIPDGVTKINSRAFSDCNLKAIYIPDSVTYIGDKAFYSNDYLNSIMLPRELEYVGELCFARADYGFDRVYFYAGNESDWNEYITSDFNMPKLIHFNYDKTINHIYYTRPGSCIEEGGMWCSCGELIGESTGFGDHEYKDWETITSATCITDGIKKKECWFCNDCITEDIPATGHTWDDSYTVDKIATATKNGTKSIHCAECDATKDAAAIYYPKKVKLSATAYTYNGKAKKPTVKVYDSKGKLIAASNYTVKYATGRKNVGKYKVTVAFKSTSQYYSGSKYTTFKINPKGTTLSTVTKGKKAFTAKWKKQTAKMAKTRITGYQIRYSTSPKMTNAKIKTVKGYNKNSLKVSNLKANKKYYVQVRTYKTVNGTKYYSGWSKYKTVKTIK